MSGGDPPIAEGSGQKGRWRFRRLTSGCVRFKMLDRSFCRSVYVYGKQCAKNTFSCRSNVYTKLSVLYLTFFAFFPLPSLTALFRKYAISSPPRIQHLAFGLYMHGRIPHWYRLAFFIMFTTLKRTRSGYVDVWGGAAEK